MVEALLFPISLCLLRGEPGKRAKGQQSSTGSRPRKVRCESSASSLKASGRPPGFASQKPFYAQSPCAPSLPALIRLHSALRQGVGRRENAPAV